MITAQRYEVLERLVDGNRVLLDDWDILAVGQECWDNRQGHHAQVAI